jgi:hypothetical protein
MTMPKSGAEAHAAPSRARSAEGRRETAVYVAALSSDLAGLARRHGLSTLAYLLDMARLEAETAARDEG